MKLAVKKTYCPYCRRLVRGVEQKEDTKINITCSLCKRVLWVWDGYFIQRRNSSE